VAGKPSPGVGSGVAEGVVLPLPLVHAAIRQARAMAAAAAAVRALNPSSRAV
jgi:hypothetical protein